MQERLPQPHNRKIIVLGTVGPDEAYRTSNRGMANRPIEMPFCTQAQIGQDTRDQVFNAVATAKHLGAGECAAGEIRLQRLDQPAFVFGLKIVLDRRRSSEAFCLGASSMLPLFEIKHRPERLRNPHRRRKRDELHSPIASRERDGAVRSTEINSDRGAAWVSRRHSSLDCQISGSKSLDPVELTRNTQRVEAGIGGSGDGNPSSAAVGSVWVSAHCRCALRTLSLLASHTPTV